MPRQTKRNENEAEKVTSELSIYANKGVRSLGGARSGRFAADMRMSVGGYGRADKTWGVDHLWHSLKESTLFSQMCAKDRMEEGELMYEKTVEDPVLGLSRAQLKKRKAKLKKEGLTAKEALEEALKEAKELTKKRFEAEQEREDKDEIMEKVHAGTIIKKQKKEQVKREMDTRKQEKRKKKKKEQIKENKQIAFEKVEQQSLADQKKMKIWELLAAAYEENAGSEVTTKSGLVIQDQRIGQGKLPVSGEMLTVKYRGRLGRDGLVFGKGMLTTTFGTGSVIAGWEEGLATMRPGGVRMLTIPPDLGYGEKGKGDKIPPHSTLFFEVELVRIGKRKRETIGEDDVPLPSSFQRKRSQQKADKNCDKGNGNKELSKSQLKRRRRNRNKNRSTDVDA